MKTFLVIVLVAAAGAGGFWYYRTHHAGRTGEVHFRTAKLEKGEIVEGVNASGALQPFLNVQVGSQISGVIDNLYKDWNDKVAVNEVVATIDSRRYVAQVDQDKAQLAKARADVVWKEALLEQAKNDLKRNQILWEKKLIADSDLDGFRANEGALRGQLADAMAVCSQSQAQLEQDDINLKYCTIYSPVKGVIVSRNVDKGQTVAASFQAPLIFVIANDLRKMQISASVPEADVGRVLVGQNVPFTVDAYPDHIFDGKVSQIRLQSTTVNNVVTYTVMIDLDNPADKNHPDGMLLPGMTANVTFEIAKSAKDSIHVMSTALRFEPPLELLEPEAREKAEKHGKKPTDAAAAKRHGESKRGRLYVKNAQNLLHPIPVTLGVNDGVNVEVTPVDESSKLEEGLEVVIGLQQEEEEQATNPFQMSMGRPRGR